MVWFLLYLQIKYNLSHASLHFMLAGHTKFAPDAGFGMLKRKLTKAEVFSTEDFLKVVDESAKSNIAVHGSNIHFYDWKSFLEQFFDSKIPNITHQHYISANAGKIKVKQFNSSSWELLELEFMKPGINAEMIKEPGIHNLKSLCDFSVSIQPPTFDRRAQLQEIAEKYIFDSDNIIQKIKREAYFKTLNAEGERIIYGDEPAGVSALDGTFQLQVLTPTGRPSKVLAKVYKKAKLNEKLNFINTLLGITVIIINIIALYFLSY